MKRHRIAVDARMVHNSGIGTVLRNLLQRWLLLAGDTQFYLLGNPELLGAYGWAGRENVSLVDCRVPIYSVQEQLVVPRCVPTDAELLWVPHYNIPVLYGGRLLVTVHDVFHLDRPEFVPGLHRRLYAKMMFRAVAERASHVVCVSEFTRKRFLHFEPGFPENETSVIPNGVDDFWQQPGRENGRIYQRPYLLFVGNVKPNKNLGRLLSAFDMVRHELPHDLVIVGRREGFITADGETLRQAEALGSRVHFTGFIADEALRRYYHDAAAFVFPSLYEGFGLPPLEALGAGCRRLVLSDIPALREVYGGDAFYFRPDDVQGLAAQLKACLAAPALPEGRVRERLARYGWAGAAVRFSQLAGALLLD